MFDQRVPFDRADLDPRYYDQLPLYELMERSRRAGSRERDKVVRKIVVALIGKLPVLGRKWDGFPAGAAGQ